MNTRISALFAIALIALLPSTPLFAQATYRGAIIETGQPILISIPELSAQPTPTIYVHDTETVYKSSGKGAGAQGNTTISGSLAVTGTAFLGSGTSTPTYTYGPHYISHAAPAANTAITILADETEIADAGANVTLTLPSPVGNISRRITLINESATYSATDGGSVTVSPGTKLELTWDVTAGQWK